MVKLVEGGRTLQATVGQLVLTLRLDGEVMQHARVWKHMVALDKSATDNFHPERRGVNKSTGVAQRENATWILNLRKGIYRFASDGRTERTGAFRVA